MHDTGWDTNKVWQLAERFVSCTDCQEIRQTVLEEGCRLFPGSHAALFALQPQGLRLAAATHDDLRQLDDLLAAEPEIAAYLMRRKEPLHIPNYPAWMQKKGWNGLPQFETLTALPLAAQGRIAEVLCIADLTAEARSKVPERVQVLQRIAGLARSAALRVNVECELQARVADGEKKAAALLELSYRDALTGLKNRRYLDEQLERWRQGTTARSLVVAICDCDGLKGVNDAFGHLAGDQYLISAAELLRSTCPTGGEWVRMGGDEFVLLWPDGETEAAQRLCRTINRQVIALPGQVELSGRLSVGWAAGTAEELDRLLKAADDKMYREKRRHKR